MTLEEAIATVYTESCVRFRQGAVDRDYTAQVRFGYLCELMEEIYPAEVERIRKSIDQQIPQEKKL